ncbi:MAG: tetratricopeptide repeat protein [Rhizobiaceae bacterium]|nr:tetratricopeptide repeat protein [Rhizobiaceae bacterium]
MKKILLNVCAGLVLATLNFTTPSMALEANIEETVDNASLAGSFLAAQIAGRDNDDSAAVAFYSRALSLDPENVELTRNLFIALMANGKIDDAIAIADAVQGGGNPVFLAQIALGVEALRKRSWTKVPLALSDIRGNDLDKLTAGIIKSWALVGAGDLESAVVNADEIKGPEWVTLVRDYHVGLMSAASGDNKNAATRFSKVLEKRQLASVLTETYARAIEALIRSEIRAGNKDKAILALKEGTSFLPSHAAFAALQRAMGDEKAVTPLVTSPQEGVAELLFNIASAIGREGGTPFAKTHLQLANYLNGGIDVISFALAGIYERQKQYTEANELLKSITDASPLYHRASIAKALNLSSIGEKNQAIASLRALIASSPKELTTYMTLGALFARDKNYFEAAKIYDLAVAEIGAPQPYHWNLFFRLAIARERLKHWDLAEPNFKKALELFPNQADVLNYLGYSWIDMGIHLDEGVAMIRKAVELKPRSGYIIDSLGWAHYKLNDYDQAVRELERAVQLMSQDATVNDHLGDAYWKVGRKLEATFQWRHALNAKPDPAEKVKIEEKLKNGLADETDDTAQNAN